MNQNRALFRTFVLAQCVVLCYSISVCGDIHRDFVRSYAFIRRKGSLSAEAADGNH